MDPGVLNAFRVSGMHLVRGFTVYPPELIIALGSSSIVSIQVARLSVTPAFSWSRPRAPSIAKPMNVAETAEVVMRSLGGAGLKVAALSAPDSHAGSFCPSASASAHSSGPEIEIERPSLEVDRSQPEVVVSSESPVAAYSSLRPTSPVPANSLQWPPSPVPRDSTRQSQSSVFLDSLVQSGDMMLSAEWGGGDHRKFPGVEGTEGQLSKPRQQKRRRPSIVGTGNPGSAQSDVASDIGEAEDSDPDGTAAHHAETFCFADGPNWMRSFSGDDVADSPSKGGGREKSRRESTATVALEPAQGDGGRQFSRSSLSDLAAYAFGGFKKNPNDRRVSSNGDVGLLNVGKEPDADRQVTPQLSMECGEILPDDTQNAKERARARFGKVYRLLGFIQYLNVVTGVQSDEQDEDGSQFCGVASCPSRMQCPNGVYDVVLRTATNPKTEEQVVMVQCK